MESSEEKFFESMARQRGIPPADLEVELAKSNSGVAERATSRPKTAHKNSDDESEGRLTIDVYQTPSDIFVESAIAGVKPEDIDVDVSTDSATIRGARHREREVGNEDYIYQECYWGRFSRSVILPQEVDPEGAEVTFKNGILTVRLPKLNRKKAKKLKVKVE